MSLSLPARAYAATSRASARALLGIGPLRRLLAKKRADSVDGRTLDEHAAAMLALDDLARRSDLRGLSPAHARTRVATDILTSQAAPPSGVVTTDTEYASDTGRARLRLYEPEGLERPSPGVVFFHGGGWVTGSVDTHDGLCRAIAAGARARVASVEYRCAPEHGFPAAVTDCLAAFRHVAMDSAALGLDPQRLAVCGDSAGGNLSAVVALRTRNDAVRPALQALLYPAVDGTSTRPSVATLAEGYFLTRPMIDWYYDHYAGRGTRRDDPDLSPIRASDVNGAPPAVIVTCGFDPLRDEGAAYAERLRAVGVRVTFREERDLLHGFAFMGALVPRARAALGQFIDDLGSELRAPRETRASPP